MYVCMCIKKKRLRILARSCSWPELTTRHLGQLEVRIVVVNSTIIYHWILTLLLYILFDLSGKCGGTHVASRVVPVFCNVWQQTHFGGVFWLSVMLQDRIARHVCHICHRQLERHPGNCSSTLLYWLVGGGTNTFTDSYPKHSFNNWKVYYLPNTLKGTNGSAFNSAKRQLALHLTLPTENGMVNVIVNDSCTSDLYLVVNIVKKNVHGGKIDLKNKTRNAALPFIPVKKLHLIGSGTWKHLLYM